MIASIIRWSIYNRFMVLLMTLIVVVGGLWAVKQTPIDAIPDLSDVQVIIKTSYPGQAPQVVEEQPLLFSQISKHLRGQPGDVVIARPEPVLNIGLGENPPIAVLCPVRGIVRLPESRIKFRYRIFDFPS